MNLINIENVTKSYTERKLFEDASFSLQEGEKVGVIGINGTGKTTLLKMIMGTEEPEEGNITIANHVVMRYLPQHPEFAADKSSLECVLQGKPLVHRERSQNDDDPAWNSGFYAAGRPVIRRTKKAACADFGASFAGRYSAFG